MKLPTLDSVKNINVKDTKTITIFIIVVIVLFAIVYVWQNKKNLEEGFAQYNVNEGDLVVLPNLNSVIVDTIGNLKNQKLPDALNTLIDNRFSTSTALNTYAKASDLTSITTKVNTNDNILASTVTNLGNLQTKVFGIDNYDGTSGKIKDINTRIDNLITQVNQNITSNVNILSNRITPCEGRITTIERQMTNSLQYIGGFTHTFKVDGDSSIANPYNTKLKYNNILRLFNWNNPLVNISNIPLASMTLPPLLPNTYYLISVSFSLWVNVPNCKVKFYCMDDNNNNPNIEITTFNNNHFGWDQQDVRYPFTYNFVVKTLAANPNIVLLANADCGMYHNGNDYFTITVNKINNPTTNIQY